MSPTIQPPRFDLRRLRTYRHLFRLDQRIDEEEVHGSRVVCIASGKGGTGKSIVATNLSVQRAAMGERVLLVDFDAGMANAHLLLGLSPRYDLGHLMDGEATVEDAVVEGPNGLHLLSGGVGRHALANPTRRELDRLFRALRPVESQYDLVLIDHGAGLGYGTVAHLAATSTLLVVTSHEVTALSDSYALYKRAHAVNPYIRVGLVVNRSPDETRASAAWDRFRSASQRFLGHSPEYIGWVPADGAVSRSVEKRTPVTMLEPKCAAATALRTVSEWGPIDHARSAHSFYDRARRALR